MGRYNDYDDELRRAEAHEKELERRMKMQDGASSPSSRPTGYNNYNNYNRYPNNSFQGAPNNYGGYNNYAAPPQQSIWDGASQSKFVNAVNKEARLQLRGDPRAAKTAFTAIAVIFYFVAVIIFAIMIIVVENMKKDYEKCTQEVEAVVVRNDLVKKRSGKGTLYYPVYEYEYNGKKYLQQGPVGNKSIRHDVGDKVTIHIDPDRPSRFYDEKEDRIVTVVMSLIAVFFFVIALIFTVSSVKAKKRIQSIMR